MFIPSIGIWAKQLSRFIPLVETQPVREAGVDLTQQTPISILLMGIDNGAEGRTEAGRSELDDRGDDQS